jgi:hypothetical protein
MFEHFKLYCLRVLQNKQNILDEVYQKYYYSDRGQIRDILYE